MAPIAPPPITAPTERVPKCRSSSSSTAASPRPSTIESFPVRGYQRPSQDAPIEAVNLVLNLLSGRQGFALMQDDTLLVSMLFSHLKNITAYFPTPPHPNEHAYVDFIARDDALRVILRFNPEALRLRLSSIYPHSPGFYQTLCQPVPFGRRPSIHSPTASAPPSPTASASFRKTLASLRTSSSMQYISKRNQSMLADQITSSPDVFDATMTRQCQRKHPSSPTAPSPNTSRRSSPRTQKASASHNPDPIFDGECCTLFTFPEGTVGAVSITSDDFKRLEDDIYLNDNLIDYELQFIHSRLATERQAQVHIFSSFFYRRLREHAYEKVRSWTRGVDIFQLPYLIVPINEHKHWYVAGIYNAKALLQAPEDADDAAKCLIFVFDSLGASARHRARQAAKELLQYLAQEAKVKLNHDAINTEPVVVAVPRLPLQENLSDCGCFLCQYVEMFLSQPEEPIGAMLRASRDKTVADLSQWFPPQLGGGRRHIMKERVQAMATDYAARHANDPVDLAQDRSSDIEEIQVIE